MASELLSMAKMKEGERERRAVAEPDMRIDYALAGYWEYTTTLQGANKWEEIEALMASASQDGDAVVSRRVGDFMRFELQEKEADYYYGQAIWKTLEKGDDISDEEMMALSEQYVYGQGEDFVDGVKKAFFWCRQAAKKGDLMAKRMMRHWWMELGSREISDTWAKGNVNDRTAGPSQREFYQAVTEKEVISEKLDVINLLSSYKKNKKYTAIDLSTTLKAKMRNPIVVTIENILLVAAFIYGIVSLIAFLLTYFSGYQESGLFYQVGRLTFFLLGFPFKFFASVFAWQGFEEGFAMTLPVFYEGFITRDTIFQFVLYLVMNLLILLVWYLVVGGITAIIYAIIDAFRIHGVKVDVQETKDVPEYEKQREKLTEDLQVAKQRLEEICRRHSIPQEYWEDPEKLLAFYDVSLVKDISLAEAASWYQELVARKEPESGTIQELFDVKRYEAIYVWYFYLCRNIRLGRKKAYIPEKLDHVAPDSKLLKAYRKYRRGTNYKSAHTDIEEIINSKETTKSEKQWARYLQVLVKKLDMMDYDFSLTGVIDDILSPGSCGRSFWRWDPYYVLYHRRWELEHSQAEPLIKVEIDSTQEDHFLEIVYGEMWERRFRLGDPARKTHWNGYETKNIWAAYNELSREYDRVSKTTGSDLEALRKKMKRYTYKGHYRMDFMDSMIGSNLFALRENDRAYQEAQKARNLEINRRMQEFDEKADSFERSINAFRDGDMGLTQEERYWRGTADQQEYMDSWALRERARDRYREEVEKELNGEE